MRILDVASWTCLPPAHGGAVRAHSLLLHLSRRHEIRQFGLERPRLRAGRRRVRDVAVTPTFRVIRHESLAHAVAGRCSARLWGSPSVLSGPVLSAARPARLPQLLRWADVVLVESPWLVPHCAARRGDAPLVLCAHNVERLRLESFATLRGRGGGAARRLRHVERLEAEALAAADLTAAVSDADRLELIERYGVDPRRVVVVPNGADTERLAPVAPGRREELRAELGLPKGPLVVFAGPRLLANLPALAWVRRLASLESPFTFLVVGTVSRPERRRGLVATGLVDDVAPYLQAADLAVCPIEHGGGTKVKLFEYLAAGLPTVAFRESLRGTALVDGEHLLVAEKSERALLAALGRLAADPDLALRLSAAGRARVVEHHDWRLAAELLEGVLLELAGERAPVLVSVGR